MIDESQTIIDEAVATAPDPEATAAPGVESSVEQNEQPAGEEASPRVFTQEEVDELLRKRLDKAERKWKREQALPEAPAFEVSPDDDQQIDPKKIIEQYEANRQQREIQSAYDDREEAALEKYDDFEQVAKNPNLPISVPMAQAIMASEIGPDVLYHLGSNPKEAARIAKLPPLLQAREIGKIEASLEASPPAKKTSSAPAPIAPVTAHAKGSPAYDTTDPRSIKSMSTSDWIAAERLRQIKAWEARR